MSGHGSPELNVDGSGLRVAIVAASWHDVVMNGLIDGARRGLADAGVAESDVTTVADRTATSVTAAEPIAREALS